MAWPRRYPDDWGRIYHEAAALRFESINTQAHRALNDLLLDGEWRTRLKCVEVWLRSGAVAYGRSEAFTAPAAPKPTSSFDNAVAALQRDMEQLRLAMIRPAEPIVERPKTNAPAIVGQLLGGVAAVVIAVAGWPSRPGGPRRANDTIRLPLLDFGAPSLQSRWVAPPTKWSTCPSCYRPPIWTESSTGRPEESFNKRLVAQLSLARALPFNHNPTWILAEVLSCLDWPHSRSLHHYRSAPRPNRRFSIRSTPLFPT